MMKVIKIILSILFLFIGAGLLSVLTRSSLGDQNAIGTFLFSGYSYMAYAIPVFYFWCFVVLFIGKGESKGFLWPLLSVIPFFTFTLALRTQLWNGDVASAPPLVEISSIFGQKGAMAFFYILGVICIGGIIMLYTLLKQRSLKENIDEKLQKMEERYRREQAMSISRDAMAPMAPFHAPLPPSSPPPSSHVPPTQNAQESYMLVFNKRDRKNVYNSIEKDTVSDTQKELLGAEAYVYEESHDDVSTPDESTARHPYEYHDMEDPEFVGTYRKREYQTNPVEISPATIPSVDTPLTPSHDEDTHIDHSLSYSEVRANDAVNISQSGNVLQHTEVQEAFDPDEMMKSEENEGEMDQEQAQEAHDMSVSEETHDSFVPEEHEHHNFDEFYEEDDDGYDDDMLGNSPSVDETEEKEAHGDELSEGFEFQVFDENGDVGAQVDNSVVKITKTSQKKNARRRGVYKVPIIGLLDPPEEKKQVDEKINTDIGKVLEVTLQEFNIDATVTSVCRGPVVTMFEILPAPGVRLRRIVELSDNIALRLAAPSVRIVAPIPGKEAVGIEVPNRDREIVSFAELITDREFHKKDNALPVALGKDIEGGIHILDLARTPHLLIAGATGSGKSVCVNSIICSILYRCTPEEVKLILIDPKIVELSFYNGIGHLLTPVISDAQKSLQALKWCVAEMERRYQQLESLNVREIRSFNQKLQEKGVAKGARMPFIVVVIDEFADLMMVCGKEMETLVSRLTAKSRAVGIHIVIATQRPSTDVITGLIKSNIPTRISFMVTSKTDSRIILDMNGAEKLLSKGDMLYSSASDPFPSRLQGPYLSEEEVQRIVSHVKTITEEPEYIDEDMFVSESDPSATSGDSSDYDPLWEEAVEEVVKVKKASASHLQRRFKIGYNRAARLVEDMEEKGIIGPQQGSKPREVYSV